MSGEQTSGDRNPHDSSNNNNASTSQSQETLRPPQPSRKSSAVLLTKPSIGNLNVKFNATQGLVSDATTAVNLENIGNANIVSPVDETDSDNENHLHSVRSNKYPPSERSLYPSGYNTDEENVSNENDEEELQEILHSLVRQDYRLAGSNAIDSNRNLSLMDLSTLTNDKYKMDSQDDFIERYISISKASDSDLFHDKLKHFFILSTAGKPIYSMNGSDDVIMGYMGFITTIVSTFQENMKEEIKSVNYGDDLKIVIMNKDPLILVAMTKLKHENMINNGGEEDDSVLIGQLNTLYNYLLAVLSKSTILKNFQNRMNYDLRKILTPLDFSNLDSLCMKLTYGLSTSESLTPYNIPGLDFFLSQLLDSSLQSAKITNTTRSRLNSILLSCKKLKIKDSKSKAPSRLFDISDSGDKETFLGDDLLFAFLTSSSGKILSMMKPKNHTLSKEDLKVLFTMISSISTPSDDSQSTEDLWIPLCMPDFNPNGFLYVFVKKIDLSGYVIVDGNHIPPQPIIITLISGNKNSFFQQQELSKHIISSMINSESFRNALSSELLASNNLSILNDIKVPLIKHFIYRSKRYNQCFMSNARHFNNEKGDTSCVTILELVYFYSTLHNNKATDFSSEPAIKKHNKRLTYSKWKISGNTIVGFMLSDSTSEFYCLCNGDITSQDLIRQSLKIIKWCEKYHRRIFVGDGVIF
ncbi:DEHA2F14652p [Debaryomyces hansenii CBS767]|uniref:Vacuolar fusion protein MON1 n=1 Tax=Debaryomyces hansenii (strain ATCC 36239 / CBS 767 / BCRC 21394 / JCM 1990 / NBRC 0083 / IGC 2968) TaxID=284592 RepID=B5RUG9_DEBHA|nr:DEHA2F14652p [Debaryomyces hansenii CBS767]CAR66347.1 DEHA2F14652p [Debaryomyces hansenii CBS767]|eukprot:XP_002770824.1 DEHA2F14652p [Debaryomyces hansenii CBS767]